MFPQTMSRFELTPEGSPPDPTEILEQHLRAGFPPDLALDLVLNELVVRAAAATHATAAALALVRGEDMVCRAATGRLAPDLGVPINTREGLSGACLQTRQPQLSVDTEFDPRIDPVVSRRLGIRSILIVPVFERKENDGAKANTRLMGMLEVFSASPAAFSHNDQKVLEDFAEECSRTRQSALDLGHRKLKPAKAETAKTGASVAVTIPAVFATSGRTIPFRSRYEAWSVVLGAAAIVATIGVSFLIGSRVGWLQPGGRASGARMAGVVEGTLCEGTSGPGCAAGESATKRTSTHRANSGSSEKVAKTVSPAQDELVVYEKGKVVFRMKPAPVRARAATDTATTANETSDKNRVVEASSTQKIAVAQSTWLAPAQAEARLLSRTEPEYPASALAAHRSGNVVLEVQVAEDGSVASIRTVSGDPFLAEAATQAVRTWRYQPYRRHDRSMQFQTDVSLNFNLPN